MAHILIVDDDESDRILLQSILAADGHEMYLASDGQEALAAFSGTPIDVVITDLQMPNVHGLELISVLRDVSPRPAIIAISGTGEPQLDIAHAIGADEALAKPVSHSQLMDAVRRTLRTLALRGITDTS